VDIANVSLINEKWKKVHNFKCLSSNIRSDGTVDYEIASECHKMISADRVHQDTLIIPIEKHARMLSDQYLLCCFQPDHPAHKHTTKFDRPRKLNPNIMSRCEVVHPFTTSGLTNKEVQKGQKTIHDHAVRDCIQQ
jgi:hypothetical protein